MLKNRGKSDEGERSKFHITGWKLCSLPLLGSHLCKRIEPQSLDERYVESVSKLFALRLSKGAIYFKFGSFSRPVSVRVSASKTSK